MINEKIITVEEAAKELNVSEQYFRGLLDKGEIKAEKIGNQWLVDKKSFSSYIKCHKRTNFVLDHERADDKLPDIVALSFFSGAMGLDLGMEQAGIHALLACEFNKACRETIYTNNPNIALIGDINKYSAKDVLSMAKIPEGKRVDIIFGGPPCQAFSTAGARKAFNDDRGNVFLRYLDLCNEIRPRYIVIENVRGLLSAPYPYKGSETPIKGGALLIILDRLNEMGYTVSFNLYNAANFGAPQIRERVVIIAKEKGAKVPYLVPTNSDDERFGLPKWNTFGDAVKDIEGEEQHFVQFPEERLKFFKMLKEGQYWKDLPLEEQKKAMGKSFYLGGGKTGFFRRLTFNKPSPTLVTDPIMPATDLGHPTADRPLSVEEYKAVQGFPENWKICGSLKDQYKQIGNAVPIRLGLAIGTAVLADMRGEKFPQEFKTFPYSRYANTSEISWRKYMDSALKKIENEEKDPKQLSLF